MATANLIDLFEILTNLNTPDGIQASSWQLFRGAIFGRDSLRVALDLLPWFPSLAEQVIFTLLRHQGLQDNLITEEEPGRIHHEYRHLFVGSRKVGPEQQALLHRLSERWGGSPHEVTYYGSIDATPQFIRLVALYVRNFGPGILKEEYRHRSGQIRTVEESLRAAIAWLEKRLEASDLGLLEFCSTNPRGMKWQVLRDGRLSYLHENGELANWKKPIASLDAQALAYDALLYAAELFQKDYPAESSRWRSQAELLQKSILQRFWLPEKNFFAMAIDRDKNDSPRLLITETSLPAELLESRLFDSLSEEDRAQYIRAIVQTMYGPNFLTQVGIRSRSLRYHQLLPLWDYQGANVSWIVMSNLFALGLRRQGLLELAEDMENRIINGVNISESFPEFYYVDSNGQVNYLASRYETTGTSKAQAVGTNIPENIQAWTVSALMRILLLRERPREAYPLHAPEFWQHKIEQDVFSHTPKATLLNNDDQLSKARAGSSPLYVDIITGKKLQEEITAW